MSKHLAEKMKCTGCTSCMNTCPQKAITMCEDEEGFLYPIVNKELCVACGLCSKVCPVLSPAEIAPNLCCYAAKNRDLSQRADSTSGGVFAALAKKVVADGGIVCGAAFNSQWNVVHTFASNETELSPLLGSKYVQSKLDDCFAIVKLFLDSGKQVLFSGTPCQVAGLNHFLQHFYSSLITVEVFCHGVPSPMVWQRYILEKCANNEVHHVIFRNKKVSWANFSVAAFLHDGTAIFDEPYVQNIYYKGFLTNLYLRPSCTRCVAKPFKSGSDLSIGDFWGIQNYFPDFNDDKGVSAVIIHSEKGLSLFNQLSFDKVETSYHAILQGNSSLEKSVTSSPHRTLFFQLLNQNAYSIQQLLTKFTRPSFKKRVKSFIKIIIRKK